MSKPEPELLKILNTRAAWNLPHYSAPRYTPDDLRRCDEAVAQHARAHPSDPFAGPRLRLYLQRGYELASDVLDDARAKLRAR